MSFAQNPVNLTNVGNVLYLSNLITTEGNNVRIGTPTTPDIQYYLNGNANVVGNLYVGNLILRDTVVASGNSNVLGNLGVGGNAFITGNLNVDTGTFYVDALNNRVGILNTNPQKTLDVSGEVNITGNTTINGNLLYVDTVNRLVGVNTETPLYGLDINGNLRVGPYTFTQSSWISASGSAASYALVLQATSNAPRTLIGFRNSNGELANIFTVGRDLVLNGSSNGSNILIGGANLNIGGGNVYYDFLNGLLGIRTRIPLHALDVKGNANVVGNVMITSNLTVNGGTLFVDSLNNRIGINKVSPAFDLDVVGNANITGNTVLNGNLVVSSNLVVDTNTLYVDSVNNRVGIRTVTPSVEFEVIGNANISGNMNIANISVSNIIVDTIRAPTNDYKIDTRNRIYQEINEGNTWGDVNGYYGLAKDAYPTLNPYSSGNLAVSTWTTRTSAADLSLQHITWSPELRLFCAVASTGSGNRVQTSPDGINWTSRVTNDNNWRSVCWSRERGIFVAVSDTGTNNRVMTSPDGITWTTQTTNSNDWTYVIWSKELEIFVAISITGTNRVMTSPDGITWTTQTSPGGTYFGIAWSPELKLFAIISSTGTGNRVSTSPDGITWSVQTSIANSDWREMIWVSELGLFVAVAVAGTQRVITSPDGINWTLRNAAAANQWRGVSWSPELKLLVAVSATGSNNRVMVSTDAINWESRTTNDNTYTGISWAPELGIFVATSTSGTGDRVMTSSLQGRPPTSYNVFDSNFNRIDQNGNWTLKSSNIYSNGNILITPVNTLDINGNANISGNLITHGNATIIGNLGVTGNMNIANISVSNIIVDTIRAPTNDYKIDTRNRIYQELNEGNTWGAVNGYYGLAKDAYPLPDPTSAGVKAVQIWSNSTSLGTANEWRGICWSPQLRIFVAVATTGSLNRAATSPDGITWTLRTTNDNDWQKVCWSPQLGLFAAVSSTGSLDRVMTSPDGITWTTQTTPNDNTFSDICWSPELELFAAVSNSGVTNRVITSPDGITWTERATAAYQLFAICWAPELSLFVGIGFAQAIVHSSDGITWTSFLSGIANDVRGITWSPELGIFVAISRTGSDRARTSPDGINWTARTIVDRDYTRVRWSPELGVFVAICNCNSTQAVTYSPDGITWTSTVTTGPNLQVLRDVAWAPELGLFAAVASAGNERTWLSSHTGRPPTSYNVFDHDSNRINNFTRDWTLQVSNLTSSRRQIDSGARLNQLLETGNSWSAINGYYGLAKDAYPTLNPYSSGNLAVSTWTTRTSAADLTWGYITWSPELRLFCAVALSGSGNRVQTSPDGINWTSRTTPVDNNWRSVCWSRERGIFVAVSITGNLDRVMTSPDGITWTTQTTNNNEWRYVIWCKELEIFVAVSDTGSSDRVMTSPDGITWTTQTTPDGGYFSVAWSPQLRLFAAPSATGSTNKIITSPDAITWTTRSVSNDAVWREMIWVSELGLFVAVAFNGTQRVITSPDGINWTLRNAAAANQWFGVAWSSELKLLVAVSSSGSNNRVMVSADAINWESRTTNSNNYFGITWAPELGIFVATATSGTGNRIMTSSLQGRPPTSYNVFDSDFNRIDQNGNWTLKSSNIYSDGNIQFTTANTTMNGNLVVSSNLVVDTNTLYVDSVSNRVGIRTSAPGYELDVGGNVNFTGILYQNGTPFSTGVSSQWVNGDANAFIYYNGGNVGIGTSLPLSLLDVNGNANISGNILAQANANVSGNLGVVGNVLVGNGNLILLNGNIGVGITNPAFKLDVAGDANISNFLYVNRNVYLHLNQINAGFDTDAVSELAINFSGFQAGSTRGRTTSIYDGRGTIHTSFSSNGNVGIGVFNATSRLTVLGDANVTGNILGRSNMNVLGNTSVSQNLTVGANANISGNLGVVGNLIATSNLILLNGNLGLGTSAPQYNLDVVGNANISGNIFTSNLFIRRGAFLESGDFVVSVGNVSVGNTLTVAGTSTLNGNLTVYNAETFTFGNIYNYNGVYINKNGALYTGLETVGLHALYIYDTTTSQSTLFGGADDTNKVGYFDVRGYGGGLPLILNRSGGNVGVGTGTPAVQLDLSTDGARKLTTTTWATGSDERIKENIVTADLIRCYNIVANIPLHHYQWKGEIAKAVDDKSMLGWIAQEVEAYFPKAVTKSAEYGLSDFRTLNADQMYKVMYGALQRTMQKCEEHEKVIQDLIARITSLEA